MSDHIEVFRIRENAKKVPEKAYRVPCIKCASGVMRPDGTSKGRLRLVCSSCTKSCYADSNPYSNDKLSCLEEGGRHRSEEPDGDDNNLSMSPLTVPRTIVQGLPRDNICYSRTSANSSDGESDSERGDNCHRADEIIPDYEDFSSEEKLDHCLGTVRDLQKSVEDISASTKVTNTEVKALKSVLDSVLRRLDQLLVEQDRARQRATTTEAVAPLPRNFDHPVPQVTSWSTVAKNSKFINNQKNKENDKTMVSNLESNTKTAVLPNSTKFVDIEQEKENSDFKTDLDKVSEIDNQLKNKSSDYLSVKNENKSFEKATDRENTQEQVKNTQENNIEIEEIVSDYFHEMEEDLTEKLLNKK